VYNRRDKKRKKEKSVESLYQETKYIMHTYKLTADKRLGQNFLIDEHAVEAIVDSAKISKEDLVIEIGPGLRNTHKILIRKSWESTSNRVR